MTPSSTCLRTLRSFSRSIPTSSRTSEIMQQAFFAPPCLVPAHDASFFPKATRSRCSSKAALATGLPASVRGSTR